MPFSALDILQEFAEAQRLGPDFGARHDAVLQARLERRRALTRQTVAAWYAKNRARKLAYMREYDRANREHRNALRRGYRAKRRAKDAEYLRQWRAKRRANPPGHR